MSSSNQHEIEATSAEVDEQHKEKVPYGMSLGNGINMTTCYKQCHHFLFNKRANINNLLVYWMMAGYVDGVCSIAEASHKAQAILGDLKTKWGIREDRGGLWLGTPKEPIQCMHKGFCIQGNLQLLDLLGSRDICSVDLVQDGELHGTIRPRHYPDMYVYTANFNPTTEYLTSLFGNENTNKLCVLVIRGCDQFFPLGKHFHSTNFENLIVLEISSSPSLTSFPTKAISNLMCLQCLNLSNLPIETLPHDFFHKLTQLRWLIIRGCSKLCSFPSIDHLTKLVVLDLSHCPSLQQPTFLNIRYPQLQMLDVSYTPIVYGFRELSTPNLTHLSLKGLNLTRLFLFNKINNFQSPELLSLEVLDLSNCEQLVSLFPLKNVPRLKHLDLSCCSSFTSLHDGLFDQMSSLVTLDLSWTKVKNLPSFSSLTNLRRLSLRGLELDSLEALASVSLLLVELDLSGLKISSSQEFELDFLQSLEKLEILNLSHTFMAKLPDMSKLVSLKELLLAGCQQLKFVPNYLQALTNLKTLDLSLPDDSSMDNHQLEFESGGQSDLSFIPIPRSLRKLVLTNRSGVQKLFLKTSLENLEFLDLRGTDMQDWVRKLPAQQPQQRIIPKHAEIHFISGDESNQPQIFEHSEDVSMKLDVIISDIRKNFNSAVTHTDNQDFKKQLGMIRTDLLYIRKNIERLKGSRNWKSRDGLLQELMDAAAYLSPADFQVDSANFKQLRHTVIKLKLLVPPQVTYDSKALDLNNKKKKKSMFIWRKNMENVSYIVKDMKTIAYLLPSYNSLSVIQKHCLLCFSIFPGNEEGDKNTCVLKRLVIKKRILINWWVGEGFIDPKENGEGFIDPTIEEIGKQILKVLVEKKFIEPVIKKGRESGSCCMHPFVHSFVIERAKEEGFFDFDKESCNLTPRFTRSRRACLVKPYDMFSSSSELWAKHINSPKKLESFKAVKTLFNVNESMIDIKREWFSKMNNLYVLHLGIWHSEEADLIEVEDQKFLEDLKRMKQLRLLSLQGIPTITKLPDSVCHLGNLMILDLKECYYLAELPTDIGSLKNLTHLDISSCPLLIKLPKGIIFLSKLEVLRGFVITDMHSSRGSQDRNMSTLSRWWEKTKRCTIYGLLHHKNNEVCTLRDLLKLERLRELSLVVNISMFPDDEELKVFKEMKQLRKLKIIWERSICSKDNIKSASEQESSRRLNGRDDTKESRHLDNIEKLELWCFPHENAPDWLNPRELKNLEKLHIVGGDLTKLPELDTDENKWNVKSLRLKYLRKLGIQWDELKTMFPQLVYLDKHQCEQLFAFPCDEEGVWKSTS